MFKGEEHVFQDGYSQIINVLARGLSIDFNQEVIEVDYSSQKGPVLVKTASGKVYKADHIIVTVPLGVLIAKDIKFTPALPQAKQSAIDRLGAGFFDKVYLEFEACFWDKNTDLYYLVDEDWICTLNCLKHHTGKPILCLFISGDSALKFAAMDDESVI